MRDPIKYHYGSKITKSFRVFSLYWLIAFVYNERDLRMTDGGLILVKRSKCKKRRRIHACGVPLKDDGLDDG